MASRTKLCRYAFAALFAASLGAVAGCSGGKASASGKVTHNGKTVVWGTVILVDASGVYHQGRIGLDGTYKVDDVPLGTVKIGVTSTNPEGGAGRGAVAAAAEKKAKATGIEDPREKFLASQGGVKAADLPHPPAGSWFALPKSAGDPLSSGMTGEVKQGQPLDIDVK